MSEQKVPHKIWLLSHDISLIEAALLVIDIEPQGTSQNIENWNAEAQPSGYLAAREAITSAIRSEEVKGRIAPQTYVSETGVRIEEDDKIDYHASRVEVMSLRAWLNKCGYCNTFLRFECAHETGFRNPDHPRYSAKLAAVVAAWEAFDESAIGPGTPKQKLEIWLRMNAARFNLVDDEGKPRETIIPKLAQVANWATVGGAPKQLFDEPES